MMVEFFSADIELSVWKGKLGLCEKRVKMFRHKIPISDEIFREVHLGNLKIYLH